MKKWITALVAGAAAVGLTTVAAAPATAARGGGMSCRVSSPISAAALNAPTDAFWSFEVFNARPDTIYVVKVNWAGDPSNAGHTNTAIETDASGYGITSLQRLWTVDGFLPGYFIDPSASATMDNFVAQPGAFSVQVGPRTNAGDRAGKANCSGTVLE